MIINKPEPFLTIKDLAVYFNVHEMTVYRWVRDGAVPFIFRVGGQWRCRRQDVDAWVRRKSLEVV